MSDVSILADQLSMAEDAIARLKNTEITCLGQIAILRQAGESGRADQIESECARIADRLVILNRFRDDLERRLGVYAGMTETERQEALRIAASILAA